MTRPVRIEYPGAIYHITSRGNGRKAIFITDKDRDQFLFILAEVLKKFNWLCHTLTLMDNHYHLIIETVDPTLSKGMRHLNGVFTQWHNAEHATVGHLFQGRFKALLIEEQSYLLTAARYVVLNPVRAKIVDDPADYRWSSYRAMAGLESTPSWLTTDKILSLFDKARSRARLKYQKYVHQGIGLPSPLNEARGLILGTNQFIDEQRGRLEPKEHLKEFITKQRMNGRPTLDVIFDDVQNSKQRNNAIALAINLFHYSGTEIGRYLKLDPSTVCAIAKKRNPRSQT